VNDVYQTYHSQWFHFGPAFVKTGNYVVLSIWTKAYFAI